jgi:hypothetical protein
MGIDLEGALFRLGLGHYLPDDAKTRYSLIPGDALASKFPDLLGLYLQLSELRIFSRVEKPGKPKDITCY